MNLKPNIIKTLPFSAQEAKLDKRTRIIEAAASTFLRLGFAETSLDEIVVHSGVVKQTIYNYFENKDALFLAVVDHLLEKNAAEPFTSEWQELEPEDFFEKMGKQLIKVIAEPSMRDFLSLLVKECRRFPLLQQIYAESIPRPFVNAVKSYIQSKNPQLSSTAAEAFAWAFRSSITGFATLSNLAGALPYPIPNKSRYLQTVSSCYAASLEARRMTADELSLASSTEHVSIQDDLPDGEAILQFFSSQRKELGEKKLLILQAAIRVLSTRGLADTSMEEIAAQAKVSKQTVYKHFRSKSFLYSFLCKTISTELLSTKLSSKSSGLGEFIADFFEKLSDLCTRPWMREYLRMLFGEAKTFPTEAGMMLLFIVEYGRESIESRLKQELSGADVDIESLSVMLRCTMGSFILLNQIFVVAENPILNRETLYSILNELISQIEHMQSE